MGRVALVVLDGLGIGSAPDTVGYGDAGSDTLGNVARQLGGLDLPNLAALGLGCCRPIRGMSCDAPTAAYGVAQPASPGKDSTTGHWELCGIVLDRPFPTYPDGFPPAIVDEFAAATGRGVIGNKAASGTEIIAELGEAHLSGGEWIVYTSADSVFQIAAHQDLVPLEELYRASRTAREILVGEHAVSRVIARPFVGSPGAFTRTHNRKDFSVPPVAPTLLDRLLEAGVQRKGVGKVDDLFAGRAISSVHTPTNMDAYRLILEGLETLDHGLIFANVIEFDQSWGHRNDVDGFRDGLMELDCEIPRLIGALRPDDMMILTADHGNDPTTASTDHSRESVPILVVGPRVKPGSVGERGTFADIGATVAEYFGVGLEAGTSFLREVWN
ncbi:MAG: phosphopentomutase [Gemmatimonadales bacterium]